MSPFKSSTTACALSADAPSRPAAEVAELAVDAALAAVREGEGAGLAGAEGVEGRAYRRQARGPKLGCRQGVLEFQGAHLPDRR
eukprot:CAMPEP_0204079392 /NCGR_PEP_ID=MMETSP0360-20130528/172343_1 /ASSEMBLY_ACC=CAM_ASM_000342 /TAXON_ID=268821 /ORGANISM="Scrippsiella Hangoei, Strain SHTV-5" /LENGTH=83 /DNA_ID=CAMNT_0051028113 /DNA_START=341 /DNA_END=589 /DNA_ORIENTATION=+